MDKINNKLNPNWITGFVDGEGCFMVNIIESKNSKIKWYILPGFEIKLHVRDTDLLREIKSYFKEVGSIWSYKDNGVIFRVNKLDHITSVIVPHFDKYPLITKKRGDFLLFKSIIELMNKSEHLNKNGVKKIVKLKASLNKGLSEKLKLNFPNIIKIERPSKNLPTCINYNWFAGFFSGEGCFSVDIYKSKNYKTGYSVRLQARAGQHSRDELLINRLKDLINCGSVYKDLKGNAVVFQIARFEDIDNKIIPLFKEYKIKGIKSLDYKDFVLAGEIIKRKDHLTLSGLEEIRKIKSRMNRNRYL